MRAPVVVVVGLLLASATTKVSADPKAIEKVVKSHIIELGKLSDDDKLSLAKDAIVISEIGSRVDLSQHDGCVAGAVANTFYGCLQVDIAHSPGKIVVGSKNDVGWFQGPFTVSFSGEDPDGNPVNRKETHRVSGIVVKDGKDWKIAAIMYVAPISDKELFKKRMRDYPSTTTLNGDKKLAQAVNGWFESGFAAKAGAKGPLIASGTSPAEYKTEAAAIKLAAAWDKLKIRATSAEGATFANGNIGWVIAETKIPKKGSKQAVAMKLAVIVVPDDDVAWRWVSIMYQPPFEIGS